MACQRRREFAGLVVQTELSRLLVRLLAWRKDAASASSGEAGSGWLLMMAFILAELSELRLCEPRMLNMVMTVGTA